MNNNENIIDRITSYRAGEAETGGPWEVGVFIDGQRVDSLPPRDGTCESDFFNESEGDY